MALIELKSVYTRGSYFDNTGSSPFGMAGYYWHKEEWVFNSATEQVEHNTLQDHYTEYTKPVATTPPSNFSYAGIFHSYCVPNTTTLREFLHNGNGGFTTTDKGNSTACGYKPEGEFIRTLCFGYDLYNMVSDGMGGEKKGALKEANSASCDYVAPVCDLALSAPVVSGNSVMLSATTSFPPVQFSLDEGEFSADDIYEDLEPGPHTYRAKDAKGCTASGIFSVGEQVDKLHYSKNPIWHTVEAVPGAPVEAELYVESAHYRGDYSKVITWNKTATQDGKCHFRLDSVLARLVKPEPPKGQMPGFCSSNILNFYVRYRTAGGTWLATKTQTVLLGGMPLEQQQLTPFGRFLTSHPRAKTVNPAQPEYLYWLSDGSQEEVRIRRGIYQNGISVPSYSYEKVEGLKKNALLCFPGYVSFPGNVAKLEVAIVDMEGELLSDQMVYKADHSTGDSDRFYLFTNSWGGVDTLRCTGEREETTDSKEELGEVDLMPGQHLLDAMLLVVSQTVEKKIKQSTGANPEWRQSYLEDFVHAAARYEFLPGPAQLLPIVLLKKTLVNKSSSIRQGYTFEYRYAFDSTGFARLY